MLLRKIQTNAGTVEENAIGKDYGLFISGSMHSSFSEDPLDSFAGPGY